MSEPLYTVIRTDTGETLHYDGQATWIPKSHELMTAPLADAAIAAIPDLPPDKFFVIPYVPLDLLRRCIEAFKGPNAVSLDEGHGGCMALYNRTYNTPDSEGGPCCDHCPICEAVRVIGST